MRRFDRWNKRILNDTETHNVKSPFLDQWDIMVLLLIQNQCLIRNPRNYVIQHTYHIHGCFLSEFRYFIVFNVILEALLCILHCIPSCVIMHTRLRMFNLVEKNTQKYNKIVYAIQHALMCRCTLALFNCFNNDNNNDGTSRTTKKRNGIPLSFKMLNLLCQKYFNMRRFVHFFTSFLFFSVPLHFQIELYIVQHKFVGNGAVGKCQKM